MQSTPILDLQAMTPSFGVQSNKQLSMNFSDPRTIGWLPNARTPTSHGTHNPRLHSKAGFQGQRTYHCYSPNGKIHLGLTVKSRYSDRSEGSTNIHDLIFQTNSASQQLFSTPQHQKKRSVMMKQLSSCLNSRKLQSSSKTMELKDNLPAVQNLSGNKTLKTSQTGQSWYTSDRTANSRTNTKFFDPEARAHSKEHYPSISGIRTISTSHGNTDIDGPFSVKMVSIYSKPSYKPSPNRNLASRNYQLVI